MQLKLPFRLTRGATVVLFIIFAHVVIYALFVTMRVKVPEMGPVFATVYLGLPDAAAEPEQARSRPSPVPEPLLEPVEIKAVPKNVQETPRHETAAPGTR